MNDVYDSSGEARRHEPPTTEIGVSIRGVSKRFGSVLALDALDLDFHSGEIHGILGQNGSGKSTLVKILSGYYVPDGGSCQVGGKPMPLPVRNPEQHGIAVIHQDLGLVESLSVMENIGIGLRYGQRSLARCNWRKEARDCAALLAEFGVSLDPNVRVADISPSERAIVALARAVRTLRKQARVHAFLLDEPTAYMPASESLKILSVMKNVAATGAAVIFISHRLDEVVEVTDRVTVLRDGRKVGTLATTATVREQLLGMMLGDGAEALTQPNRSAPRNAVETSPALRVDGLSGDVIERVSFETAKGEIVGLAGLTGMGQEEVPYLLAGATRPHAGHVTTATGREVAKSPAKSFREGVVLVPADRRREGVWLAATAAENITLPNLRHYFRGWLRRGGEVERAQSLMIQFQVRPADPHRLLSQFSGGNQQKILLAKWLQEQPAVLLLVEPTQGVDVGARHEIHEVLRDLALKGAAVIVCSSDQEELALLCSRVLVFRDGSIDRVLVSGDVTQENIVAACQAEQRTAA